MYSLWGALAVHKKTEQLYNGDQHDELLPPSGPGLTLVGGGYPLEGDPIYPWLVLV